MNDITVDYDRLGWNQGSQWLKVGEELGEVIQAIVEGNPVNVIRESLDVMETMWTYINMVAAEYNINLARLVREHDSKLIEKGYLHENIMHGGGDSLAHPGDVAGVGDNQEMHKEGRE